MNVFFGKMNDATLCAQYLCSGGNRADHRYFGGMEVGDLVFVRLKDDGATTKRLWKLERLYLSDGKSMAKFVNAFPNDEFFSQLSIDELSRLDLFNVGIVLGNKIWKQTMGVGFFKLDVKDMAVFEHAVASAQSFNQYIKDRSHFRDITFVRDNTVPHSDRDIQICKAGESYAIYNGEKPFLSGIKSKFNSSGDRYPAYIRFLKDHPGMKPSARREKVKKWLESEGNERAISIVDLWDFFCSQQPFKAGKNQSGGQQEEIDQEVDDDLGVDTDFKNLIIYGIPGCGKSYRLKTKHLASFDKDMIVRTTFHPEYSNTDFVGQVRPVKKNQSIDYTVIPGPFTEALKLAFDNPEKKVALVIEEINRGNAAAIFGDLFQLLDRDQNGRSEYEIKNIIISEYLGGGREKIYIPSNLYLYATMNTSDQNVFKLDTAFKRRWEFERLTNEDTLSDVADFTVFTIDGNDIRWKEFVQRINAIICANDDISGDRQIGNFFYVGQDGELQRFANKVLEYLYNDVFRYGGREDVFNTAKYKSFDEIYDAFVSGENVFADGFFPAKSLGGDLVNDVADAHSQTGQNPE